MNRDSDGSVRDIVDTSGTVLYHTGYDSFGNKVSSTGSGGDRFGFTGREQYDPAFWVYAGVLLLGATCWLFINPTRVIGEKREGGGVEA